MIEVEIEDEAWTSVLPDASAIAERAGAASFEFSPAAWSTVMRDERRMGRAGAGGAAINEVCRRDQAI